MSIRHVSFKHGWFYHYRVHETKTERLCNNGLSSLSKFLNEMFTQCPEEKFSTTLRSSALKFHLGIEPKKIEGHEISKMAEMALDWNQYRTAHSNVQVFMLQNDEATLGVEVPIWMDSQELTSYTQIFNCEEPLSGHIDLIRVEDGKIWIWDYKPNAEKERYATTQVYFYALMMSKRTGIPLERFMCGYFDETHAFVFKPEPEHAECAV